LFFSERGGPQPIRPKELPAVVGKRFVGVGHAVSVLTLLHGTASSLGGVEDFGGKTLAHRALSTSTGVVTQPAKPESHAAVGANLDWDLEVGAANTTGFHFHGGLDVVQRLLEDLHRIFASTVFDDVECAVDDALGGGLFAVLHDDVDELGDKTIAKLGIGENFTFRYFATTRHS
jgi:hypothetical protein